MTLQLLGDWIHEFATATGMVLEAGRRVIIYNGKEDYICNYIGGEGWTNVTQWKGQVRERVVCYGILVGSRSAVHVVDIIDVF